MQNEILLVAESVSGEKSLPKESIFEAIELALASATKKRYSEPTEIIVEIDTETGNYLTYRTWLVTLDEEYEFPGYQLTLDEAKKKDETLEIGSVIKEQVENVAFGRIAAQAAKQVIVQKVREAERSQIVSKYKAYLGEMVNGEVKKVNRDFLIVDLGDNAEAILPRTELIQGESFRLGERIKGILFEEERENRGSQLALSRKCPEMVEQLFRIEVPEISEQVIEIKAVARDAGSRSKIAVKTNDNRIDPVGACVGMRGSRVQAVSSEIGNERIDIIIWDDDPAQLVINSMGPADITSIVLDETKGSMDITVTSDTFAQAIGKSGQNVRLASQLTGWKLNVLNKDEVNESEESNSETTGSLILNLDIEEEVAELLEQEGLSSIRLVADSSIETLASIDGFDDEIASVLIDRAKAALLESAIDLESDLVGDKESNDNDLMSIEGIDVPFAMELNQAGIKNKEDLAEQSVDELLELVKIDEKVAADLIMKARAHWFENE
tara:strand:- start:10227 stop:11717 length:1491 start_codon:yes stop_codon:yes gene_type:complete